MLVPATRSSAKRCINKAIKTSLILTFLKLLQMTCRRNTRKKDMSQAFHVKTSLDRSTCGCQKHERNFRGLIFRLRYRQRPTRLNTCTHFLIKCGTYSKQNSKKMLKQIERVLKNKGYYICITYGDPDIRNHYF